MKRTLQNCARLLCLATIPIGSAFGHHAIKAEYEFVVVGSGPGGGPLAANLARAGYSVLLLEAGSNGSTDIRQKIPFFADTVSEDSSFSWEFFTSHYENQTQAIRDSKFTWKTTNGSYHVGPNPPPGSEPLGIYYPRGAMLGGSSNNNAMGFVLPPDSDWDNIAKLTGDSSWSASNMRQYFERLEDCQYLPRGTLGHGFDGYIQSNENNISMVTESPGFVSVMKSAVRAFGNNITGTVEELVSLMQRDENGFNPLEQEGIFQEPVHVSSSRQRSSAQTYLTETVNAVHPNGTKKYPLTISTESLATRVLFDTNTTTDQKPKAIGMEYLQGQSLYKADARYNGTQNGTLLQVFASREVIISAGVFNTPQLLKLSGIGPRDELESFNISVIVDLPAVGANMQENYETPIVVHASQDFSSAFENCTFLQTEDDPCLAQWEEGTGPYGGAAAPAGFLKRTSAASGKDVDLFLFGAASAVFRGHFPGFSREQVPANTFFWSIVKINPTPKLSGTVKLRSANPQDVPQIDFHFFPEGSEDDIQAIVEGVEFARGIFADTPAPFGPFTNEWPNEAVELRQGIRDEAFGHHATCTCKIGIEGEGCVDSKFRVFGVEDLRVVDGSVFPKVPGAFPVLPTFMVSEKATDAILESAI